MYERYTRQSLPSKKYRELLGTAICVFNANNAFIIENILRSQNEEEYNWYDLIDRMCGGICAIFERNKRNSLDENIYEKYKQLVYMRDRIVHSFQITDKNNEQVLATKERKTNNQFIITEDYLMNFIERNEELCSLLYKKRDEMLKSENI